MGIEDLGALGKLAPQFLVPLRHQPLGTLQRLIHSSESSDGRTSDAAPDLGTDPTHR